MDNKKNANELHTEHKEWVNRLEFVRDEIHSFKNRLSELLQNTENNDVRAHAEHYQNQFIRHNEVIDELVHDINEEEHKMVVAVKKSNVAADENEFAENDKLVDRMETFDKIYGELKSDFMKYLSDNY